MLEKMLVLGEDYVCDCIKIIGLFCNKVKNVVVLLKMLIEDFGGEVLVDCDSLVKLLGVGCKMVNVVLNEVFG